MERGALKLNRVTASILATACIAMAILSASCGGGGGVNLTRTGGAPSTSVSPTSLAFASQAVGAATSAQVINLTNSGNAALSVNSIAVSGANANDFAQTNNCGSSVAAASNCTISVTFKPSATGTRSAAVTLSDNATGSPQTVALSGSIATTLASVSPSSLALGDQPLSTASPVQAITLANTGNADLSVTSVAVSGANASDFAQTNNCGSSVAAGANCTISVSFKPAAAGTRTAAVIVADSAPSSPQTVALSGTGDAPVASVSSSSVAFGNQSVGASSTAQAVTLTNSGNAALSVTSIAVFGTNAGDFAQTNNCGISVAAGANCTISLTFTPSAAGSRAASLAINDNATGSPQSVSLSGTGISTVANVSPSSLAFGNQSVGASSTAQAVTLTNSGNSALSVTSIAVFGTNASDFAQTNNCGISVAAGANCTISITFTPSAAGSRAAALAIADNAAGSPQSVSLSGTGISTVASVSPSSVAFGNQSVGATSTSQAVTLTNSGNSALSVTSIAVFGSSASDFAQTNNCGSSLAAGANCTISVTFTPTATGTRTATVTLTDDAASSPQTVALSGTGNAAIAGVSASSLTFASQAVGATSAAQTITLANSGNVTLRITGIALSGTNAGDFAQTNNCGSSVAAGASCAISVTFKPIATGTRTAAVAITDNDTGSPQTVPLSGTIATTVASASPSSLTFASQAVGATSAAQAITLANTGNAVLNVTAIAVSGANAGDFALTNNCGSSVAAGANCTINVTFKPIATGTRTAAVAITDNAAGSPQSVSLSGTGISTVANVSPSSLAFGNQSVGAGSTAQAVTLTNSGNAALSVTSIAVFGINASDFAQTNNCGISVAAGANCTISLTFTPSAAGSRAAALAITDNATGSPQSVSLSGTGISTGAGVSATSLAFGNQSVGASSTAQAVTLSNSGNSALSVTSIAVFGTNASDFAQTNNCGISVAAGANCTISVTFTPSAPGSRAASLAITDNATGSPQSVSLTGTGTAPAVSISPTSLTFASQVVGATSAAQTITLTNTGNATLSITSIASTGANATDFTQIDTCGASVAAGGNCTIAIMFTPSTTGTRVASLGITDNATGSPQPVSLSGTGTQAEPTGHTYYVDNCVVIGSDGNNGTSTATPWLTINKVNTSTFNPGDSILFESTCTWREQLTVPSSGSAGSPITFGAYGTGAQPIISGADLVTSWITAAPYYYAFVSVQPNIMFRDGTLLTQVTAKGSLATGDWWWDSTNAYVWLYDNPSGHTIEAGTRPQAILTGAVSNVTFTGLHATKANHYGIQLSQQQTVNVTINAVTSDYNYECGIFSWTDASDISTGGIVANSTLAHNGGAGINFGYVNNWIIQGNDVNHNSQLDTSTRGIDGGNPYTTDVIVQNNSVYENGSSGIDCDTCGSGIVFRYNNVWGNAGYGLALDADNNAAAYYNLSYNNGNAGIAVFADANSSMTGMQIYNNTLYGNVAKGIWVEGPSAGSAPAGCTNNTIENNIVVGTVGGPNLAAYNGCENPGPDGSGNVYTYNDFGAQASNFIQWGAGVYESTYTAWETSKGNCGTAGCSHSVQGDPQFVNASAAQFWLQATSPAIDTGTNLGSPYNSGLLPGSSWPNSVLTGDQNSYGSGWEVGAYIFTGQTVQ